MLTSIKDTAVGIVRDIVIRTNFVLCTSAYNNFLQFIVPKGFCVTVFAFELQLHAHKELQKIINDIENVSIGKKDGDLQQYCDE